VQAWASNIECCILYKTHPSAHSLNTPFNPSVCPGDDYVFKLLEKKKLCIIYGANVGRFTIAA
jgi:hypothetical protein